MAAEIEAVSLDSDLTAILVTGDIEAGDALSFRNEAAKVDQAIVMLESDGGSTLEAIEIGEAIRLKGFSTLVINGSDCFSACALIWLAGAPRSLSKSARVGFHASYTDSNGQRMESGVGNALVGRYLTLLNLPAKAVVYTTSAPPNGLNWVNQSNYSTVGIDIKFIDDWTDDSGDDKNSRQENPESPQNYSQYQQTSQTTVLKNIGAWTIGIDHTLNESCFAVVPYKEGTVFRIGFNYSTNSNYVMIGNNAWQSLRDGDKHNLVYQFDDLEPWDAPASVVTMGNSSFLWTNFSNNEFWDEFVSASWLNISRGDRSIGSLSLYQSAEAMSALADCQKTANRSRQASDPFAD
ncbi:hypothetical protein [Croceicoccus sp. Ery15]|uniref:COG3904 family protein n=1 Tax=Croceicoccus sp. Ery15 TaxID=1703338 RepID=UPI001E3B28B7|nr:hypothetical protein [Croceicoccus sp. Ery15]